MLTELKIRKRIKFLEQTKYKAQEEVRKLVERDSLNNIPVIREIARLCKGIEELEYEVICLKYVLQEA